MANFNVPAGKTTYVTRYEKFRGVDFSTDPALCDSSRSPEAPNLISDFGGMPEKRTGWRTIQKPGGKLHGMWAAPLKSGDTIVCHAGTKLYRFVPGNVPPQAVKNPAAADWQAEGTLTLLRENIPDGDSDAFFSGGKLYILTGAEYLVYGDFKNSVDQPVTEIRDACTDAYIPTTSIGAVPAISNTASGNYVGATSYEAVNLLTGKRINTFCTPGTASGNSCRCYLDTKPINSVDKVELNGQVMTSGTDYGVNLELGFVEFLSGHLPAAAPVPGRDNLKITFTKNADGAEKVKKCRKAVLYAGRVFITGNPDEPAMDWHSGFEDFSYFPDLSYTRVGNDGKIMGYLKSGEALAIFKEDSGESATVYLRTQSTLNGETVFPLTEGITGAGAISPRGFGYLGGEPLFLSRRGVMGLSSNQITAERSIQNRSYYADARLTRETLKDAVCAEWNGCFLVAVGGRCYVLDGRQQKSYRSQSMGDYVFECYFWENIPATCFFEQEGALYFGTADGRICRFNSDMDKMAAFSDDGTPISCAWSTKADDDGNFMQYKSMTKRGCGVMMKPYARSSVQIAVRTEKDFGREIRQGFVDIFDWTDLDFSRFTFNSNDAPRVIPFNTKVKKYSTLQIITRNTALHEGFGVYGIVKQFTRGNSLK